MPDYEHYLSDIFTASELELAGHSPHPHEVDLDDVSNMPSHPAHDPDEPPRESAPQPRRLTKLAGVVTKPPMPRPANMGSAGKPSALRYEKGPDGFFRRIKPWVPFADGGETAT